MSYQHSARDGDNPKSSLHEKWFGGQEMLPRLNLSPKSHRDPEIHVFGESDLEIVFQTRRDTPVKLVTKLLLGKDDKRNLSHEYVLAQRNRETGEISFRLGFPDNGHYRFQIFALDEANRSDDLPNVFNYLIHVDRIHYKAEPFPKQFSDLYDDYDILEEPLRLNRRILASSSDRVRFCIQVPGAQRVGVHCDEEWTQLDPNPSIRHQWVGNVDLSKHRSKNGKLVSVAASYGNQGGQGRDDDYLVLVDYTI